MSIWDVMKYFHVYKLLLSYGTIKISVVLIISLKQDIIFGKLPEMLDNYITYSRTHVRWQSHSEVIWVYIFQLLNKGTRYSFIKCTSGICTLEPLKHLSTWDT